MTIKPQMQDPSSKKDQIRSMFDQIAHRYDRLNGLISLGIDHYWRKKALEILLIDPPKILLDLATGTGDFALQALEILKPEKIIGVDISENMLEAGRKKITLQQKNAQIDLQWADAENLPFPDDSVDAITVAFGVRNFENLEKGLSEALRVLKPKGKMVILELTEPTAFPMRQLYRCYAFFVLPLIGKIFFKNNTAYRYLPASIAAFVQGEAFLEKMKKVGFKKVSLKKLTLGITTIYVGEK